MTMLFCTKAADMNKEKEKQGNGYSLEQSSLHCFITLSSLIYRCVVVQDSEPVLYHQFPDVRKTFYKASAAILSICLFHMVMVIFIGFTSISVPQICVVENVCIDLT